VLLPRKTPMDCTPCPTADAMRCVAKGTRAPVLSRSRRG
jgi:hypothetical protein